MKYTYPPGATPLNADEASGLIPDHITTQDALNEWEQQNILDGLNWALKQHKRELLDDLFVRDLHKKMFDKTWKWAGTYRRSNKNIGIEWQMIPVELRNLFADVSFQIEHNSFPPDELATRFHHRLVAIHPFPNGNGRHARMMADLLIQRLEGEPFSWGGRSLVQHGDERERYIAALQAADKEDYTLLMEFVRS
ncbi:mobile mystery protein B [Desulfovibrio subterraneus]|uniref:Cell division protein Fic n=1 Tax=Desulfovibrio subterraneus TaxID=2718620 RepID=A0A7J0BDS2_9BACT|nr:mobile mystery protein B [Desulfovibrio subterraneus]GFM31668.1 cell division protein Fic [Desulfovibrio subterraneus]